MNGKIFILSLALVAIVCAGGRCAAQETVLLRDGFVIAGIDGKVSHEAAGDKWFFEFASDISDDKGRVGTGSKLELLPSVALEKIEANFDKHPSANYRLWARVTRFEGKNYIYGIYFLTITQVEAEAGSQDVKVSINEPNDPLALPDEIVSKLKTKKIIHFEQLEQGLELKEDSILADRIGFIIESKAGSSAFVLDGLGRNRGQFSLELLPCEVLEQAKSKNASDINKERLKVAGIVTRYKGQNYLLLQRATQVYSYGNFGK